MQANLLFGPHEEDKEAHLARALAKLSPRFMHTFGDPKPLGIGDIHEIQRRAFLAPGDSAQAFVIRRADEMTREACQALLKIIEEPPQNAYFFFLAKSSVLPETILSRVAKFSFFRAGSESANDQNEAVAFFDSEIARLKNDLHTEIRKQHKAPATIVRRLAKSIELASLISTSRIPPRYIMDTYDASR